MEEEASLTWDPRALGPSWRRTAVAEGLSAIPRTWEAGYDEAAAKQLDQALSRALDALADDGRRDPSESGLDAIVELRYVPALMVRQRGDYRYGSSNMAEFLGKSELDLIPIICSALAANGPWQVLDGHHRLRAYIQAKRAALAFCIKLVPGTGLISLRWPRSS